VIGRLEAQVTAPRLPTSTGAQSDADVGCDRGAGGGLGETRDERRK